VQSASRLPELNISRSDWWIVTTAHSNVLIEGPESTVDRVIDALAERLRAPVTNWIGKAPEVKAGTLVVRAVDTLDGDGQRTLLDYLTVACAGGALQVVSTSAQSVFPMIDRGLFLEELYYRLNTVLLHPDPKSERRQTSARP
jgi:hypothetical protein